MLTGCRRSRPLGQPLRTTSHESQRSDRYATDIWTRTHGTHKSTSSIPQYVAGLADGAGPVESGSVLSDTGALVVRTGKYTGRAPDDKFIVDTPSIHDYIAWNNINRPISKEKFNALKSKMLAYFQNRPCTSSTALPVPTSSAARNSASSMNWPANVSSSATSSSGRQPKSWPSTANRISPSSRPGLPV